MKYEHHDTLVPVSLKTIMSKPFKPIINSFRDIAFAAKKILNCYVSAILVWSCLTLEDCFCFVV